MTGVIGLSLTPVSKPSACEPGLEEARVLPQPLDELRFLLEHLDRGEAGGGDGRRVGRREEKRPGAVVEELDQRARAGDVAAQRADRFRQRPDLDVDAAVHPEMVDGAAAMAAEHAARMRVVDHHDAAELVGQVAQLGKGAEVAVHAEDAVGDDERPRARAAAPRRCGERPRRRDAGTP